MEREVRQERASRSKVEKGERQREVCRGKGRERKKKEGRRGHWLAWSKAKPRNSRQLETGGTPVLLVRSVPFRSVALRWTAYTVTRRRRNLEFGRP